VKEQKCWLRKLVCFFVGVASSHDDRGKMPLPQKNPIFSLKPAVEFNPRFPSRYQG
jgi:hypothetical protein